MSAVLVLGTLLFFGLAYPFHVRYQEQYQLFEWTSEYFGSVASVPGGLADWTGRFLVQFFIYPWAGAFIVALCLFALHRLVWHLFTVRTGFSYALSMVPSALVFVFLLDDKALISGVVALIFSLAASSLVNGISNGRLRIVVRIVVIPILYWIAGPLAIVSVLISLRMMKPVLWPFIIIVAAACPLLSQFVLHHSLRALLTGIHYYRYPLVLPAWLWGAALASVLCSCINLDEKTAVRPLVRWVAIPVTMLAVVSVMVWGGMKKADHVKEDLMAFDMMAHGSDWSGILELNKARPADKPLSVSMVNLALSMTDGLAGTMFGTFQSGVEGLFPAFVMNYSSPLPTSEIFWRLGMVNACQYYVFEAQEAIPDFQKSARCYQRLAQTNIVNGDYEVARKYLQALENTLFYRKWARSAAALLWNDQAVGADPECGPVRKFRCKEHDSWFKDSMIDVLLEDLVEENPDNTRAYDYLLAWDMLESDLDSFAAHLKVSDQPMPVYAQEAYMLHLIDKGVDISNPPTFVDADVSRRFMVFINDMQARKNQAYMRNHHGGEYWYYSICR